MKDGNTRTQHLRPVAFMLPDEQLQLLTAAVDGELSPTQSHQLRQLLDNSADAQTILARLRSDRLRLCNYPTHLPPASLAIRIASGIAAQPRHRNTLAVPSQNYISAQRRLSWIPLATAASLLAVISALSFGFFARSDESPRRATSQVTTVQGAILPVLPPEGQQASVPTLVVNPQTTYSHNETPPVVRDTPNGPLVREFVGPPLPKPSPVFVAPPPPPIIPFSTARVHLPFLTTITDLDREEVRHQFVEELLREPAWRIDLFTTDPARGADQLIAAGRANGITIHVDAIALDRIRRKQSGAFLFYTEALTVAELRELFGKLASDQSRSSLRVLDSVHLLPLLASDHRELRDVLGFDPAPAKKAATPTPQRPEVITKPISDQTGGEVVRTLTTQSSKASDKHGVLLSWSPRVNPMMSRELADYRTRRGERKSAAIPVMIVIRAPG